MRRVTCALLSVSLLFTALPAAAADGRDGLTSLKAMLLANSGRLRAERATWQAAEGDLLGARGGFVPHLSSTLTPGRTGDALALREMRNEVTWAMPAGGGNFSLGTWLYPDKTIGEPGGVVAQWRQPLLRGLRLAMFGDRLQLASLRRDSARMRYAASVQSELLTLEQAYWDLALRRAMAEVAREEVERARTNRQLVETRIQGRKAAEFERDEADQALLQFRHQLIMAQQEIRSAESTIVTLVGAKPPLASLSPPLPEGPLAPPFPLDVQALTERALRVHADIAALRARAEEASLDYAQASWDRLPALHLVAQADWNGAGRQYQVLPITTSKVGYAYGISFESTLGPSPEWGEAAAARAREEGAAAELKQARFALEQEIALTVAETLSRQEGSEVSARARQAAERRYLVEQERFAMGLVALPDLLRYHRAFSQARLDALQARVELLKVYAKLRRQVADPADDALFTPQTISQEAS
jgi:outer membrane protein TolC